MTRQEENWELMTMLQMPWHEADKIEGDSDRKFLLVKVEQIKDMIERQRKMAEEEAKAQGAAGGLVTPPSSILQP
jgi:hypothetical protein